MPKSCKAKLVIRAAADFLLRIPKKRQKVVAGTQAIYDIQPDPLTGFTDDIDLEAVGLPTGAVPTFTPSPLSYDEAGQLSVITTGVAPGSYGFDIGGSTTPPPGGNTIYADSLSRADVQAAIDATIDGDTVVMPAGAASWGAGPIYGNAIRIIGKSITLMGAGKAATIITDATGTGIWPPGMIYVSGNAKCIFRDFAIHSIQARAISMLISPRDWMVHDMSFIGEPGTSPNYRKPLAVYCEAVSEGNPFGLIYSCDFQDAKVDYEGQGYSDTAWANASTLGTADAMYVEDCNFVRTVPDVGLSCDNNQAGRTVYRYCIDHNGHFYAHVFGTMYRGARHWECYNNTFKNDLSPATQLPFWIVLESGTGVVWGNRIYGDYGSYHVNMQYQRAGYANDMINYGSGHDWQTHNHADGSYVYNGRQVDQLPVGWPARDQPGRGQDGVGAYPQAQADDPIYIWDNLYTTDLDGTPTTPATGYDRGGNSTFLQVNRDWFDSAKPGYVPYTYPHPLRG